ncbi:hypothetical protein [Streptomyces thermospinosisporus]
MDHLRCLLAFSLRVGQHYIAAEDGSRSRAEVMEMTRGRLLR